jgi:hypothetical protein
MEQPHQRPPEMAKVGPALRRAAQRARELARLHGVPLVIWRDGRIVHIPPGQIEDLPEFRRTSTA